MKTLTGVAGIGMISKSPAPASHPGLKYRQLGNSGLEVSQLCFGAPRTNNEALIKYALDKGINFIDTGRSYGNGNNEKLVGRSVAGQREKVVIQSKIRLDASELVYDGKGRKGEEEIRSVLGSRLDDSLKALGTGYIDILLYHDASKEQLLFHPETLRFFADMKKEGKIRLCGFSTHNDCMNLVETNNSTMSYDVVMVPYNHKGAFTHSLTGEYAEWDQSRLTSLLSEAAARGRSVIAMKTCSGGPYSSGEYTEPGYDEAVRWVLNHDFISAAAIAMATFEQLEHHLPLLSQ